MEDNDNDGDEWRIVKIDESNYKAVCDLIELQHLDTTSSEVINSILELEVKAWIYRNKRQQDEELRWLIVSINWNTIWFIILAAVIVAGVIIAGLLISAHAQLEETNLTSCIQININRLT